MGNNCEPSCRKVVGGAMLAHPAQPNAKKASKSKLCLARAVVEPP